MLADGQSSVDRYCTGMALEGSVVVTRVDRCSELRGEVQVAVMPLDAGQLAVRVLQGFPVVEAPLQRTTAWEGPAENAQSSSGRASVLHPVAAVAPARP